MVRGLERFREHFAGYSDRYVLIGGTAATLTMKNAGLSFRATKGLDILLVVEALDSAFGERVWQFVNQGGYELRQGRSGHPKLYRFEKPTDADYPYMIELFSRQLDEFTLGHDAKLTPLPLDGTVSNLSAILLDDEYYNFVMQGRRQTEAIAWIDADRLIPLKASAWLDLTARQAAGEQVDGRDIRKHLNDVFRLAQLLTADQQIALPAKVAQQLDEFLARAAQEIVNFKQLKIAGPGQVEVLRRLRTIYGLPERE